LKGQAGFCKRVAGVMERISVKPLNNRRIL